MTPVKLLIALCCLLNSALAASASAPSSYALENTEVRDIHAKALNRDYQVYVALPDSYTEVEVAQVCESEDAPAHIRR